MPTADEAAAVESYVAAGKDVGRLARPERFFAATLRWPGFGRMLEAACFRAEFDEAAWDASRAADCVAGAAEALMESAGLARVLRYLLKAGNTLNSGLANGNAAGVALDSLDKFATARGKGGMNLVDYVAQIFHDQGAAKHLDFVDGLPSLSEASRYVDDDHTRGALRRLKAQLRRVSEELQTAEARLSKADRKSAAAARKAAGDAPSPEVAAAGGLAPNALDAAATKRFVIEAGRCVDEAGKAATQLEAKLQRLKTATDACYAYFGVKPGAGALKGVFSALDGFASEVPRRDRAERRCCSGPSVRFAFQEDGAVAFQALQKSS